jgi:hypothetical protein
MPDENLLVSRQFFKAVGVNLRDGRFVDTLEQVFPLAGAFQFGDFSGGHVSILG